MKSLLQTYIDEIDEQWRTGRAREHSYRPALQQLLANLLPQCIVTNEPARSSCGAPDYIILQKGGAKQPIFFVEAKDLFDNDLDGLHQHKEQFSRYKSSLDYIIFTDYLDFHFYAHGEKNKTLRIGEQKGERIQLIKGVEEEFEKQISLFANSAPLPIASPSELAKRMAGKARLLADVIQRIFNAVENVENDKCTDTSPLVLQYKSFKQLLIQDLNTDYFADLYAQTICYGMFIARLYDQDSKNFSRQKAASLIPPINPFLRYFFQQIAGFDLDLRIAWIVDDLAQTFSATDMETMMQKYELDERHTDFMIHFYEEFLSIYDAKVRKERGVWYTPQPIVRFIVRAVDEILQTEFHISQGLADASIVTNEENGENSIQKTKEGSDRFSQTNHRVHILDPATGTGTFLAEVVRVIHKKFEGMEGMWQNYVEKHLLPRLHGFELLMAPYSIAHLTLDMLLRKTGYDATKTPNQRLQIYLTNSLEEGITKIDALFVAWLYNEVKEANLIKKDAPIMVLLGNPPYSGISQNNSKWITQLVKSYKQEPHSDSKLDEKNPKWINDDYVKFIRLAEYYIDRNKQGVIGYITNNGFIDNPTFRGMRWHLLETFDKIYILNLHGNAKKKETCPDGSKDENVFDIMQGVSINLFVKTGKKQNGDIAKVFYKDLYGSRESKFQFLSEHSLDDCAFTEIDLRSQLKSLKKELKDKSKYNLKLSPFYFLFCPTIEKGRKEYEQGIKIDKLMPINTTGIVTSNDTINISYSIEEQNKKLKDLVSMSEQEWRNTYNKKSDSQSWKYKNAQKDATNPQGKMRTISYRPFDARFTFYTGVAGGLYERPREKVMQHFLKENVALCLCGQIKAFDNYQHCFISNRMIESSYVSNKTSEITSIFPLYTYKNKDNKEKTPNLNPEEWDKFNQAVGRETSPEELMYYIYAVLHSPSYRERYKEFLKIDFPRIPLPASVEEWENKVRWGEQLVKLHLLEGTDAWPLTTKFPISGSCVVEKVRFEKGRVWINETQYFDCVPEEAWNARIGGYQPAQKWLKDRKGRTLSFDDIQHYRHILHSLTETERIMKEIG